MPRRNTSRIPSYRLHKSTGLAVVRLNGRDVYLGRHGSEESRAEYQRVIAEWLANGRHAPPPNGVDHGHYAPCNLTINDLFLRYWQEHVCEYYIKDGKPTNEQANIRQVMAILCETHGHTLASSFGPLALKAFRGRLLEKDLARRTINRDVDRVKRMFRWAGENEIVSPQLYENLRCVPGLKRGRCRARESEPVTPAPEDQVEAVLAIVSEPIATMIRLQRYTGMRPDEVVRMRTCDLDRSEKIWGYTPQSHKTQHHGRKRKIFLGPRAQQLVQPFLERDESAYLFSPMEAEQAMRERRQNDRKTPMSCGNRKGTNRKTSPRRRPQARYTVCSYRRAIHRACEQAFPPPPRLRQRKVKGVKGERWETYREWRERLGTKRWRELKAWRQEHQWSPNQLRHSAATFLRKEFGIDAARVILGHSSPAVTEIYAELDFEKARKIMGEIG